MKIAPTNLQNPSFFLHILPPFLARDNEVCGLCDLALGLRGLCGGVCSRLLALLSFLSSFFSFFFLFPFFSFCTLLIISFSLSQTHAPLDSHALTPTSVRIAVLDPLAPSPAMASSHVTELPFCAEPGPATSSAPRTNPATPPPYTPALGLSP